jgi:hypothetical protein
MTRNTAENSTEKPSKSRYQLKQLAKRGRGRVNPNWQWWMDTVPPSRVGGGNAS